MHIVRWIVLAILLMPALVLGQDEGSAPVRLEPIDNPVGLSHNTINTLLQDRQGFLWIGTADGLNRFDGYAFTVYRHDPGDSTSLSNNNIRALLEDRAGHLWVATDAGLNAYDPAHDHFVRHPLASYGNALSFSALFEDEAGFLWLGTIEGLFRYDPAAQRVQAFGRDPGNPSLQTGSYSYTFGQDSMGRLWMSRTDWDGPDDGDLYRYDLPTQSFARFAIPDTLDLLTLHLRGKDSLWIGDGSSDGALRSGFASFSPSVFRNKRQSAL